MNIKQLIVFLIVSFVWIGFVFGQANSYGMSDKDGQDILVLIKQFNLVRGSMAYRSAELPRMLGEVNYFSEQLKLPTPHPIKVSDIQQCHVIQPWYAGMNDSLKNTNIPSPIDRIRSAKVTVMGTVETTNFFFAFNKGYLWNVIHAHESAMNPENFINLVGVPSLVNDTQSYQLAIQWLSAVSVDIPKLEKKFKPQISQQSLNYPQGTTNIVLLPIYYVQWGESPMPLAKVTILGTTKELIELKIQGDEISSRQQMVITNAFELCSKPDPQLINLKKTIQTNSP